MGLPTRSKFSGHLTGGHPHPPPIDWISFLIGILEVMPNIIGQIEWFASLEASLASDRAHDGVLFQLHIEIEQCCPAIDKNVICDFFCVQ